MKKMQAMEEKHKQSEQKLIADFQKREKMLNDQIKALSEQMQEFMQMQKYMQQQRIMGTAMDIGFRGQPTLSSTVSYSESVSAAATGSSTVSPNSSPLKRKEKKKQKSNASEPPSRLLKFSASSESGSGPRTASPQSLEARSHRAAAQTATSFSDPSNPFNLLRAAAALNLENSSITTSDSSSESESAMSIESSTVTSSTVTVTTESIGNLEPSAAAVDVQHSLPQTKSRIEVGERSKSNRSSSSSSGSRHSSRLSAVPAAHHSSSKKNDQLQPADVIDKG